jgi:hypothetical protein
MVTWIFFADMQKPHMQWPLAKQMARSEKVIVVRQAVSVLRNRCIPPFEERLEGVEGFSSCWNYRPLHFPERLPGLGKFLKQMNRRLMRQELDRLSPPHEKRIVCYDLPTECDLVKRLGEELSIYLATDDLTITVWGDPLSGHLDAEKRLLAKIDVIFCVSQVLARLLQTRLSRERPVPIHILPNGYEEGVFNPEQRHEEPAGLRPIPRPRILVAGYISERVDWDGIQAASKSRPEWRWVFIGPPAAGMEEKIQQLGKELNPGSLANRFPRLVWLGDFGLNDVPAFIEHCDVCAIPYRVNRFTQASNPIKAFDYLGMGAPVLSTRIPSLESYGDVIEWVEEGDGESYGAALNRLMAQRDDPQIVEKRRGAVRNDSWPSRAQQFRNIVGGIQSIRNNKAANRNDARL